jgi:hypothetical protein
MDNVPDGVALLGIHYPNSILQVSKAGLRDYILSPVTSCID